MKENEMPGRHRDEDPGSEQDRRVFIQRTLLALLSAPIVGTAFLTGCSGENTPFGWWLRQQLQPLRLRCGDILAPMRNTLIPTNAQMTGWIGDLNAILGEAQAQLVTATEAELRANFDPDMQPVTDRLTQQGVPPQITGPAPQFTEPILRQAVTRTELILAGASQADRRALWAFLVGLALLAPQVDDNGIRAMADAARQEDTNDVGGEVYEALFGPNTSGADGAAGIQNRAALFTRLLSLAILILLALGVLAAESAGIFLAGLPQVAVALAFFFFIYFPVS